MKTIAYNISEEFKAVILIMVLSFAFLISKAQVLPIQPVLTSFAASTIAPENTLIPGNTESVSESATAELSSELKSMISSGSYWSTENESASTDNLKELLTAWMKNGNYWEDNQNTESSLDPQSIAENKEE